MASRRDRADHDDGYSKSAGAKRSRAAERKRSKNSATFKVGFGFDKYVGDVRENTRYSIGAGLTYKLNRQVQIKGEFRQDWLRSNVSGVDYTASIFLLGLRLQY